MRYAIRSLGVLGVGGGTDKDQLILAVTALVLLTKPAPLRLEHRVLSLELLHLRFQELVLFQRRL